MEGQYLIATAFGGEFLDELGVNTVEAYREKNKRILAKELPGHPLFSPLSEHGIPAEPTLIGLRDGEDLTERVATAYKEMCAAGEHVPGKFGDLIQLFRLGDSSYQMLVSKKAFKRVALAADFAGVIRGTDEAGEPRIMLITGTRRADPGKGQPALLGGFTNVSRDESGVDVLDSFAYTLLHEGLEEANLRIEHDDPGSLQRAYEADSVQITAYLGPEGDVSPYSATMINLGLIQTSDLPFAEGGEAYSNGEKRVHLTNGFVGLMDVEGKYISQEVLSEWLTAGDDIGALQFHDITRNVLDRDSGDLVETLAFGVRHHEEFIEPVIETAHQFWYGGYTSKDSDSCGCSCGWIDHFTKRVLDFTKRFISRSS